MKSMKMFGRVCFLVGLLGALFCLLGTVVYGAEADAASAAADGFASGMAYIGAALSTGIAAIGGGIAVGAGAPAAIGALTEDSKTFGKALIFVALGEGIALYGMLISILILNKV
ncbi:MAG: ATP synthase subunit C [Oscillospiraceae bacterium]